MVTLPDPLISAAGHRIDSAQAWWRVRRPELAELFQQEMYGAWPAADGSGETVDTVRESLGAGSFTLRELVLHLPGRPPLPVLTAVPNRGAGPVPVVVSLNYTGNETVPSHRRWPLELIADRGYAVITADYRDIRPDVPDLPGGTAPENTPAIMAWAWGLRRLVDVVVNQPDAHGGRIDPDRIAAAGQSRLGKAALLATAFDDRIGLALVNQAGCGGSAPSRTDNPGAETVARMTTSYPHWFADRYATFGDRVDRLPFDQHDLVALCAPRPILFTCATGDQWADPPGQFDVLRAASPVYRLLGVDGMVEAEVPTDDRLIDSRLGYRLRAGKHDVTPDDWRTWLDYADVWLARR